jgi:hypothetical protein
MHGAGDDEGGTEIDAALQAKLAPEVSRERRDCFGHSFDEPPIFSRPPQPGIGAHRPGQCEHEGSFHLSRMLGNA